MPSWTEPFRAGEARKVWAFLLVVALVGGTALLVLGGGAPTASPTPASVPTPSAALPSYDELLPTASAESGPGWTDLVGVLVKLGAVLALLAVALRGLQRLSGRAALAPRGRRALEVLESASLGQGASVYLVAVGPRVLVLGSTTQRVSLLAELDATAEPPAPSSDGADFETALGEARSTPYAGGR